MPDNRAAKLSALILAAGASTRLGQPKQLVEWQGETLVRRVARQLLELGATPVIAVLGHRADGVGEALEGLPVRTVLNPRWQEGLGSSIAAGCPAIPDDSDGVLISLCDQWRLQTADLRLLIRAWVADPARPVAAEWQDGDTRAYGAPAIFPRALLNGVISIGPGQGAKAVLARHSESLVRVPLQAAATDLDRPGDLEALQSAQSM